MSARSCLPPPRPAPPTRAVGRPVWLKIGRARYTAVQALRGEQHLGGDPAKRVGGSPLALRTKNAPALDLQAREGRGGRTGRVEVAGLRVPARTHARRSSRSQASGRGTRAGQTLADGSRCRLGEGIAPA